MLRTVRFRCLVLALCAAAGACGSGDTDAGNMHRPTVGPLGTLSTPEDTPLQGVSFVVADIETPAADLLVTATSEDPSLVRSEDIEIEGVGATRTLSVVPVPNAHGTARITISVADPDFTGTRTIEVDIVPVNDPPVVRRQRNVVVEEDESFEILASDLVIDDPDDSVFDIVPGPGEGYSTIGMTVRPTRDFSGSLSIPVTVSDGDLSTGPFSVEVTVRPVNDAPVITGVVGGPFATDEDEPFSFDLDDFTITDVDSDSDSFAIVVVDGRDYSADGATVVPTPEFSGEIVVAVSVTDGQAVSAPVDVSLSVARINDAPVIAGQSNLAVEEDTAFTIELDDLVVSDVDSERDSLSVTTLPGPGYTLDDSVVTPARDFAGTLSVSVVVTDGDATSDPFAVAVEVTAVNDPPVVTDDAYETTGNRELARGAGDGVLGNDVDVDGPADLTVRADDGGVTVNGGAVAIESDGSFVYHPPGGFIGTDSFAYTATDGVVERTATVTIAVTGPMVWFVDNRATAGGDGRSHAPFATLAAAAAVAPATAVDEIHVSAGDGTPTGYDQGVAIGSGFRLIGVASAVADAPTLTATGGAVVRVADGNELRNLRLRGPDAVGVVADGSDGLVVDAVEFESLAGGVRLIGVDGVVAVDAAFADIAGAAIELAGGGAAVALDARLDGVAVGLAATEVAGAVRFAAAGEVDRLLDVVATAAAGHLAVTCDGPVALGSAVIAVSGPGTALTASMIGCDLDPTGSGVLVRASASDTAALCLDVRDNAASGTAAAAVAIDVRDEASLSLPGYAGAANDAAAAATFLDVQNAGISSVISLAGTSAGIAGDACPLR